MCKGSKVAIFGETTAYAETNTTSGTPICSLWSLTCISLHFIRLSLDSYVGKCVGLINSMNWKAMFIVQESKS